MNTEMSGQIDKIAPALVKFQSAVHGVAKSSENDFYKSKYADLHALIDATRAELIENGLAVTQYPAVLGDGGCGLVTLVLHESGQWIRGVMPVRGEREGPQPFGSAYTYMRRYAYAGVLGIAQMDDDAEAATFRMSKIKTTQTIDALVKAADKDDLAGCLQVWEELSQDEMKWINTEMDSVNRKKVGGVITAARAARDAAVKPDISGAGAPIPISEKDHRREKARGGV